jgi:nickel-dependent lactate racemase
MVPVHERFDIVITSNSGYPLDLNVYQSVKGMSAAAQMVKEGGSIIVVADCWDGIPEHGHYGQLLSEAGSAEALLEMVRDPKNVRQDKWQAHIQALISQKADVYFYSHNLADEQIRNALLIPCGSVGDTVEELMSRHGVDSAICVLPEGPQTVPYVARG